MASPNPKPNALKQKDIISFFGRKPSTNIPLFSSEFFHRAGVSTDISSVLDSKISVTYQRRNPKLTKNNHDDNDVRTTTLSKESIKDTSPKKDVNNWDPVESDLTAVPSKPSVVLEASTKQLYLEKKPGQKRVFSQYFLELGQPDFFLSTCSVCGLKYSRGYEEDEKVHKSFHRRQLQGIRFKGWQNERIVNIFDGDNRIILVLNSDPSHHQSKVNEIVRIMENEMGLPRDWLLEGYCKVYLFISSKKIIGCLVSEPIKYGYKVIPQTSFSSTEGQHCDEVCSNHKEIFDTFEDRGILMNSVCSEISQTTNQKTREYVQHTKRRNFGCTEIQFGNGKFERKAAQETNLCRDSNSDLKDPARPVVCSKVPVPAVCGVKGVWVLQSERRRGIATKLLDTMRKSFCLGYVLEPCQCAFSQPTSDGKAFASSYCKRDSFLIYKSSRNET